FSVVFTPLNNLIRKISSGSQGTSDGELYEGFVLLPADAEAPSFIIPAKVKAPKEKDKSSIVHKEFKSVKDIKGYVKKPIYVIDDTKQKVNFVSGNVFSYFDEEIFGVSLGFIDPISETLTVEANIALCAQYDYPRPYPLWDAAPTDEDHPGYVLEKVDYLPTPGIKIVTLLGFVFCWIEKDVLYTLVLENHPTSDEAVFFVSSLTSLQ
ncbi:MAG: hypothetical protein L0287_29610, partial [Anaerolineae bacterium]|nr:hypothetical protein [Anaerolineae bacterium]